MDTLLAQGNSNNNDCYLSNLCGQFNFTTIDKASLFDIDDLYTYYLKFSLERSTGIKWRFTVDDVPQCIEVTAQKVDTYENVVTDIDVETKCAWEDTNNSKVEAIWGFTCKNGHNLQIIQGEDSKYYICLNE